MEQDDEVGDGLGVGEGLTVGVGEGVICLYRVVGKGAVNI